MPFVTTQMTQIIPITIGHWKVGWNIEPVLKSLINIFKFFYYRRRALDFFDDVCYRRPMYLFLDNEMGGLEKEQYSLLTSYLLATDDNFNVIAELDLRLKPNDGICA